MPFGELSNVTFLQNMMEMGLSLCQKSGIKVAFDSEEWLWIFVESVVLQVNESYANYYQLTVPIKGPLGNLHQRDTEKCTSVELNMILWLWVCNDDYII